MRIMDEDVICIDNDDNPDRHGDGPDAKKKSKNTLGDKKWKNM